MRPGDVDSSDPPDNEEGLSYIDFSDPESDPDHHENKSSESAERQDRVNNDRAQNGGSHVDTSVCEMSLSKTPEMLQESHTAQNDCLLPRIQQLTYYQPHEQSQRTMTTQGWYPPMGYQCQYHMPMQNLDTNGTRPAKPLQKIDEDMMTPEQRADLLLHRERNRKAAERSRHRKKEALADLQRQVTELRQQIKELEEHEEILLQQIKEHAQVIADFRAKVSRCHDCGSALQRAHLDYQYRG